MERKQNITKNLNQFKSIRSAVFLLVLIVVASSCKKFIEIDPPPTQISAATVYANNSSAAAVMTSVYDQMVSGGLSNGSASISYLDGLAADELTYYGSGDPGTDQFYTNSLSSSSGGSSNNYFWPEIYNEIHITNVVLEGLAGSKSVTSAMKLQLTGEAKFMRAFLHFYAVNLYGDVPLVLTSNYVVNNAISRTPKDQVYQQIIQDLKDAENDLNSDFLDASGAVTTERARPNKGAATALLARVYLYVKDWKNAQIEADAVIKNTTMYSLLPDLNDVFKMNSGEAIWQMAPSDPGYNTKDAPVFVLTSPPGLGVSTSLSDNLLNQFESGDKRFVDWVGSFTDPSTNHVYYFPYKYKVYLPDQPVSEYLTVLRLAEQYLIRAESEANGAGPGLSGAITDLNIVRARAGLLPLAATLNQAQVLAAIAHERQIELFTEWGHRWFDLKRTGALDAVMGSPGNVCAQKGGAWNPDWALLPLPLTELQLNRNLKQNPGY